MEQRIVQLDLRIAEVDKAIANADAQVAGRSVFENAAKPCSLVIRDVSGEYSIPVTTPR